MNRKGLGIFLFIFGIYLLVGNTILSLFFNFPGFFGWGLSMSSPDYWSNWWNNNGLTTILVAVAGLVLMVQGIRVLIRVKKKE